METENRKEVFENLNRCRREVDSLRSELNALNDRKESLFRNKEKISNEIISLIRGLKSSKRKRDDITKWVREAKDSRSKLNDEIKVKINEVKELNKKKMDLMKKHRIKEDPSQLKSEIDKLEYKIETEGLPYSQEQKLMKVIKEKRKAYEGMKQVSTVFDKVHELSKEIDRVRAKADETHKKIQAKAKTSQDEHEGLIESSKEIDELRVKEKEAMDKFIEAKNRFNEVNAKLESKLLELSELRMHAGEAKGEIEKVRKSRDKMKIEEMQKNVEEKLKRGEKLTTEDLIAMRGMD